VCRIRLYIGADIRGRESDLRLDKCGKDEWIGNMNGKLACETMPKGAAATQALRESGHELAGRALIETK
jgi:hypothetical protein